MVATVRKRNEGDNKTGASNEISEELLRVPELIMRPLLYLVAKNRMALYDLERRYERAQNHKKRYSYISTYPVHGEILIPNVVYRKEKRKASVSFWVNDLGRNVEQVRMGFYGGFVLIDAVYKDQVGNKHITRPFIFPPITLESYTFLYANSEIVEDLLDYLESRKSKQPMSFISNLEFYQNIENGIGSVSELPLSGIKFDDIDYVDMHVGYEFFYDNKIHRLEVSDSISDAGSLERSLPKYYVAFEFDDGKGKTTHELYFYGRNTLYILARHPGFEEELKRLLERFSELYTIITRGALVLVAQKRAKELL